MEQVSYARKKVFDPFLRLIHFYNALLILTQMIVVNFVDYFEKGPLRNVLWQLHVWIGYGIALGFITRLVWAIIGPATARFSDFWYPSLWIKALRTKKLTTPAHWGHHPLASAIYLLFYLLLSILLVTGLSLAAIKLHMGPLSALLAHQESLRGPLHEIHELIYDAFIGFVVLHLGALIWHEIKDRTPLAQAMVTGYQYQPLHTEESSSHHEQHS